jgi:hypothetical protein
MKNINEDINRIKNLMNLKENEDGLEDYYKQKYTGQDGPHDEDDMAPDGMDDDSDLGENELSEDDAAAPSSTGGGGYPTVTKWDSGAARGKGNPIDFKKKWESGLKRGKGNTLL